MTRLNRRNVIASLLGWPILASPGCSRIGLPPAGELKHTSFSMGHRIRDGNLAAGPVGGHERVPVVIVGGGVSGLSAAWCFKRAGFHDFVVLELEDEPGGTSRSGTMGDLAYPWGAHYIPSPMRHNLALIALLREMKVLERVNEKGDPVIREEFLCRDPQERLFQNGNWREGIYPADGATSDDLRQLAEFRAEVDRWVGMRDAAGRRMFAVPIAAGTNAQEALSLDRISMATWLDQHGWDSPRLRWLVNYGCRDDYGLTLDQVSAWAGVFYFASRVPVSGQESQEVITWPEGNGFVVDHFVRGLADHIQCRTAVTAVSAAAGQDSAEDGLQEVLAIDIGTQQSLAWQADRVILATPQMMVPHLLGNVGPSLQQLQRAFRYGSWVVANVHLSERPAEAGFPTCWDNVFYDSGSLGYVSATHQQGVDTGPTVLTWYHPFADAESSEIRKQMLSLDWSDWSRFVLDDLLQAHPDLGGLVTRLDVMLWGHAMIQPRVGFVWGRERLLASRPRGSIHFAGTDLSGIALFEEAFFHGIRAAEEVMEALQHDFESMQSTQVDSAV